MKGTPKVISKNKIKFSDEVEITVCILDNGMRIIPEADMLNALQFLGFSESEINQVLTEKLNKQ